MIDCKHPEWRFLDCEACDVCEEKVCVDCGFSIKEEKC